MKKKSETAEIFINFVTHLKLTEGIKIKKIRCDNAGENKALQKLCMEKGLGITFQFTAPNTPQQNGVVERSFATSYGRMRAILNEAGINGPLRKSIWAEVANYETDTANILVSRKDEMCPYEKFYGRNPGYVKDLTAFGKICISKRNDDLHRIKLTNKGIPCMMVGYAKDNATGT